MFNKKIYIYFCLFQDILFIIFTIMYLCGFPFLVGFYSKDSIIEYSFSKNRKLFFYGNIHFE